MKNPFPSPLLISFITWVPILPFQNPTMLSSTPPPPSHETFLQWATDRGITTNGVTPTQIPNRGLGITAHRRITPGEELLSVPASALFSINSIPRSFRSMHEGISSHGLLASFFTFAPRKHLSGYRSWMETWPRSEGFSSFPMCWDDRCRSSGFLPPGMIGRCWRSREEESEGEELLCVQEKKFKRDWEVVSRIFPRRKVEEYRYGWLLVNTRSLYCDGLGGKKFSSREERMVLCPFVDLFNHDDHGVSRFFRWDWGRRVFKWAKIQCAVRFDKSGWGYRVLSDRVYGMKAFLDRGLEKMHFLG